MANQYTTIEELENYLLIDIDADFEAQVESWIEDMTQYIESQTGLVFIADSTASVKIYEITNKKTDTIGDYTEEVVDLEIDDCVEVVSLTIDDELVDEDDYLVYPANSETKTRIHLTADSGLVFTEDEQNIEVEAKWGATVAVPNEIKFACTVLVAGIINNSLESDGEVKSVTMGSYNLTFKDNKTVNDYERVQEILESYNSIDV